MILSAREHWGQKVKRLKALFDIVFPKPRWESVKWYITFASAGSITANFTEGQDKMWVLLGYFLLTVFLIGGAIVRWQDFLII
jgi:hypothetical protein